MRRASTVAACVAAWVLLVAAVAWATPAPSVARLSARSLSVLAPAGCTGCPSPAPCQGCWHPGLVTRWQYQLQGITAYASTGGIDVAVCQVPFTGGSCVRPRAFDIDLYVDQAISGNNSTVDAAAVDAIHTNGGRAICYVDAGTWEKWRPDASRFPSSVLGRHNGWPGERWLDIRQTSILVPLMDARVAMCAQAGFDAVEFDNVDGAFNRTGFPLSENDQLVFDATMANLAHQHALSVGLKNDVDANQIATLLPYDFAVNEQCAQYRECSTVQAFVSAGKAVFNVEYKGSTGSFCPAMNGAYDFNSALKTLDLFDLPWTPCR